VLCDDPMLFHGEATFKKTHNLVGELSYFLGLLDRREIEACHYRLTRLTGLLEAVFAGLTNEIQELQREVRDDDRLSDSTAPLT
jgi:hypothetical protein